MSTLLHVWSRVARSLARVLSRLQCTCVASTVQTAKSGDRPDHARSVVVSVNHYTPFTSVQIAELTYLPCKRR